MLGRMPVAGGIDGVAPFFENHDVSIDQRNNFFAPADGKTSPRKKIVLKIDDDKGISSIEGH